MSSNVQLVPQQAPQPQQEPPPQQVLQPQQAPVLVVQIQQPQPLRKQKTVYYREDRGATAKYYIFEVFRIFQLCVCLYFIIVGISKIIISLMVRGKPWYFFFYSSSDMAFRYYRIWIFWDILLWFHIFVSIFGFLGAAGHNICFQIIYAVLYTPFFPYCIIPWILVYGMCEEWGTPPFPRVISQQIVYQ